MMLLQEINKKKIEQKSSPVLQMHMSWRCVSLVQQHKSSLLKRMALLSCYGESVCVSASPCPKSKKAGQPSVTTGNCRVLSRRQPGHSCFPARGGCVRRGRGGDLRLMKKNNHYTLQAVGKQIIYSPDRF